jgi:hypothetical protein
LSQLSPADFRRKTIWAAQPLTTRAILTVSEFSLTENLPRRAFGSEKY